MSGSFNELKNMLKTADLDQTLEVTQECSGMYSVRNRFFGDILVSGNYDRCRYAIMDYQAYRDHGGCTRLKTPAGTMFARVIADKENRGMYIGLNPICAEETGRRVDITLATYETQGREIRQEKYRPEDIFGYVNKVPDDSEPYVMRGKDIKRWLNKEARAGRLEDAV